MKAMPRWEGEFLARPDRWDGEAIELWLQQAADTLRRLPDRERAFIYGRSSGWPDFIRSTSEAYGYDGARARPGAPDAHAIDNLGHVLGWFSTVPRAWRRLVWARACGIPASKIAARIGCNRSTVWRTERRALARIAEVLNGTRVRSSSVDSALAPARRAACARSLSPYSQG